MIEEERDIDLFAGAGGWDEGVAGLGVRPLGVEWDDAACATRGARGHETLQADVSQLDPAEFALVRLMIASPPCQAFSMAGSGHARRALEAYVAEIRSMMAGHPIDRERLDRACSDERGHLVLEPLRWALAIRPRFIACENVDSVLALWEAMADALRELGYGTWAGMLSAERYGVPQTRGRAFLLAKLDGQASPPPATHQRYIAPRVKAKQEESLFDAPEPERIVAAEDRELLPWVSMAEALGWGMTARRTPTLAAGKTGDGRLWGSDTHGGAMSVLSERDAGRWVTGQERIAGPSRDREPRSVDDPSYTIRTATGSGDPGVGRTPGVQWVRARDGRESAPRDPDWPSKRPATTVAGDPRLAQPGHKNEEAMPDCPGRMEGAVRVSVQEAAVLQGFPPDYPWQGTRTAQYRQIGDAVPPPWARAILAHLLAP